MPFGVRIARVRLEQLALRALVAVLGLGEVAQLGLARRRSRTARARPSPSSKRSPISAGSSEYRIVPSATTASRARPSPSSDLAEDDVVEPLRCAAGRRAGCRRCRPADSTSRASVWTRSRVSRSASSIATWRSAKNPPTTITAIAARLAEHEPRHRRADARRRAGQAVALGPRSGWPEHAVNDVRLRPVRHATKVPLRSRPAGAQHGHRRHAADHDRRHIMRINTRTITLGLAVATLALSPAAALAKHGADDGPPTTSGGDDKGGQRDDNGRRWRQRRDARHRHLHRRLHRQAEGQARRRPPRGRVRGRPEPQRRHLEGARSAATASW